MSRRHALPGTDEVERAKNAIVAEATASARRPSVLTLARRLGLSNTTLRRHFPDVVREISAQLRAALEAATKVTHIAATPRRIAHTERPGGQS